MKERTYEHHKGLAKIAQLLTGAFAKIEAKIKGDLKRAYRDEAASRFECFMNWSKKSEATGHIDYRGWLGWYEYVDYDKKAAIKAWEKRQKGEKDYSDYPADHLSCWEDVRKYKPFIKVSYYHADKNAEESFERARYSFIVKNMTKMENILGTREDVLQAKVEFNWVRGVFEGKLEIGVSDGKILAEVGLKYVIRRIPHVTPYFQYPLVFVSANIAGTAHKRPSEKELKEILAGSKVGVGG